MLLAVAGYLLKAKPLIVTSNSMFPLIKRGDLVVIFKSKQYEIGDIISFKNNGGIITHRLVSKIDTGFEISSDFETKGDANQSSDFSSVSNKNILGKVKFIIPFLGFLFMYLQSKYFVYFLILILIFVLLGKIKNAKK